MNHAINVTDSDGNTAQHLACREGNVTCIHQLIRYGADVDARDSEAAATQPHVAAFLNHDNCVKTLVNKYAATVDARNMCGGTPLHVAALSGSLDVIEFLVCHRKANVYSVDCRGRTVLDCAVELKQLACVRELLKAVQGELEYDLEYKPYLM